jgi:hypothetical protein
MKILIVAQARSGSSFLAKDISAKMSLDLLWEPFNINSSGMSFDEEVAYIYNKDNIVVKIVDNHFNKIEKFKANPEILFERFDLVIGLTRRNDVKCGISRYLAKKSNYWGNDNTKKASKKILWANKSELHKEILFCKQIRKEINSFRILQTTYEDLYINNNYEKFLGSLGILS